MASTPRTTTTTTPTQQPAAQPAAQTVAQPAAQPASIDKATTASEWMRAAQAMKARSAAVDWGKADWSKLQPSDIGVHFGPMMSEEEFKEYQRRKGAQNVHVVSMKKT